MLGTTATKACQATATPPGAPVTSTNSAQPRSPTTTKAALNPEIDKILTRLADREVQDLRARLTWRLQYVIDPDATVKRGEFWYQKSQPVAKFLIHFQERISGDRKDRVDERYMFDGRFYVEQYPKVFTRREVRRPNDSGDPYNVSQGVFPLPFGQKKEEILREYDVQYVRRTKDDPPATDHLLLTPHAGTRSAESYKTLDFWIDQEGPTAGLPTKVRVTKLRGTGQVDSYITITFEDVKLNEGYSSSIFVLTPPPGYEVSEEKLDESAGEKR